MIRPKIKSSPAKSVLICTSPKRNSFIQETCIEPGCTKFGANAGKDKKSGITRWKARCIDCHKAYYANQLGLTIDEWVAATHPYLWARKHFCENCKPEFFTKLSKKIKKSISPKYNTPNDHLPCTAQNLQSYHLQVDHIDGNHQNNVLSNLQTLCGNCHTTKSLMFSDGQTPGRKTKPSIKSNMTRDQKHKLVETHAKYIIANRPK